uniref:Uncharacterized protein n=1 Tax=Arundo donax TaxID=35708 RepID=A0A0A8XWV0_ARUDO
MPPACQVDPLIQGSAVDANIARLRIKRPVKVPKLKLHRHKRRGVASVPLNTRTRNKATSASQQSRRDGNFECQVSIGALIDFLREMNNSSQEMRHRSIEVRGAVSWMNLF